MPEGEDFTIGALSPGDEREREEWARLYERVLRATREAHHAEMGYREEIMLEAAVRSHPSIAMVQVTEVGLNPRWGVASVWPQPGVASGGGSRPRDMGGAGVDPAPDSAGVGSDQAGDDAGRLASAFRRRMISRRGHFVDPEQLSDWRTGPLRGASFIGAWADEIEEWKDRQCD